MGAAACGSIGACLALWLLAAPPASAAPDAPPAPGRHAAQLCVATRSTAPPSCGPAQADVAPDGALRVRVDDVVYHLHLLGREVAEVVLTHGAVQIDEFSAPYAWVGGALTFSDAVRGARYEVRFVEPPAAVVNR